MIRRTLTCCLMSFAIVACGVADPDAQPTKHAQSSADPSDDDGGSLTDDAVPPGGATSSSSGDDGSDDGTSPTMPTDGFGCFAVPPSGATSPPAPKPYSGGSCPALSPGLNTIDSGGATRQFILALPSNLDPSEPLPLVFLWHWLGGDAQGFHSAAQVQAAADHYRIAAIVPQAKGDLQFKWPIEINQSNGRIAEELQLFDDLLACASEQLNVNRSCVSSVGVSAGALFTTVLAGRRGEYLSSFASLSGGSGGFIQGWGGSSKKMPAMVLWGGPTDGCAGLLSFDSLSKNLESELASDGHAVLECVHNCGHSAPPFDAPGALSPFAPLWEFALDHPYWLDAGDSPYLSDGLPAAMPDWCAMGVGSAAPRQGTCNGASSC
jgi:predicted esterase